MSLPLRLVWIYGIIGVALLTGQTADEVALQVDAEANLATASAPAWPAELKSIAADARVQLRLAVDDTGQVTSARVLKSPDERLNPVVLATVKQWIFRPALISGQAVATGIDVDMPLVWPDIPARRGSLPLLPPVDIVPSPRTGPQPLKTPPGKYPDMLAVRQIAGEVAFRAMVKTDGSLRDVRLAGASHPDFVQPAWEALHLWVFKPAMQGDQPIESPTAGVMTFDRIIGDSRAEILAANGLTAPDGQPPALHPEPVTLIDPVRPFEELMNGEPGWAVAEFTVSTRGVVTDIETVEASTPASGRALAAALQQARFLPAASNGQRTTVRLRQRVEFAPVAPGNEDASVSWQRVLAALRQKQIGTARGLDERLTPLHQVPALYPRELAKQANVPGEAEIEIVIDRTGRVQLPRIVSATHEAFGWAAATAASMWVFKAPMRGGEAVDVRVRIPFQFQPDQD
jgi:TonB family protein